MSAIDLGRTLRDGLAAGAAAGVVSGVPSTAHALATGMDPREPTLAAGSLLFRSETRPLVLGAGAVIVHGGLSAGWGVVLAAALPARRTVWWGGLAGLAIAALDLGVIGRRFHRVAALRQAPQVADHLIYGLVAGAVIARRREQRAPGGRVENAH